MHTQQIQVRDKAVLVLGLGDTGLSALRWLVSQGARVSAADTRVAPPNMEAVRQAFPELAVHLGPFESSVFEQADLIVISPGVPLAESEVQAAIRHGKAVVGDVELFAHYRPTHSKVIAITGSNGKSTVTTMVGDMCSAAGLRTVVAGNIGLPVLDALQATPNADVYVLELSSFQLETTSSLAADAVTVLNLSEDHLDRYAGMAEYAAAKARILIGAKHQVLNADDTFCMAMASQQAHVIRFSLEDVKADYAVVKQSDGIWLTHQQQPIFNTSDMRIAGLHNAANALAALALCESIGLPRQTLLASLRNFKGLPHRVEWVAEIAGVAFFDDSKGTNVGATCAAMAGLPNKVVLIAGGEGKDQDFAPLAAPVAANARAVVLIGRDAPLIERALSATQVPLLHASSMESAVELAHSLAQSGDAVLLSPACASFDMFRNYAHRAEVFINAVMALKSQEAQA